MTTLAENLNARRFIAAPGVHDGFSALLADRFPFDAIYMSGYCVAGSRFGLPDAGLIGLSDMLQVLTLIRRCTTKPIIADADTGYGGLLNVQHTVREYEATGAAAIQIEDQEIPKKCGHTKGKRVVSADDMAAKVAVAAEARRDPNFLIIARTDALATHGAEEAIARAKLYRRAGADVVFIDALDDAELIRRVGGELGGAHGKLMINVTPPAKGFVTPQASPSELAALGFSIAIYPGLLANAALGAMEAAIVEFQKTGLHGRTEMSVPAHELVGFPQVWADEARWASLFAKDAEAAA